MTEQLLILLALLMKA